MKIKLLASVGINGTSISKGEIVEVTKELAAKLIDTRKAVESKAQKKTKK